MWQINELTTRLSNSVYVVLNRHGTLAYMCDDFGNLVPANGLSYLIG